MAEAGRDIRKTIKKGLTATTAAAIGTLGVAVTIRGAAQEAQPPQTTSTPSQKPSEKLTDKQTIPPIQRPPLLPATEYIEVVKPTWLELITKDPHEKASAKKLIDRQNPRVRGIAIAPETQGPSPKFQQILNYRSKIEQEAKKYGLRKDVVLAIFLIEGWLDDSLAAETAGRMGLRVDEDFDERKIPFRYIEGMVGYLAEQRDLWADLGVAVASFNGGPGYIAQIIYQYARTHGVNLPTPTVGNIREDQNPFRDYVKQQNFSIYKLLTDPSVASYLHEEAEVFTFRVAAAIEYLVENSYLEKELIRMKVPVIEPSYPKPRTNGAVV